MKASLCMIVWNEEASLPVAMASAEGLADEVVVVDTGSSDETVKVARDLGAKVITGADRWHKGKARNAALGAATGDWCVVLDADERIADPVGVRASLEGTDAQAVYIKLVYVDGEGNPTLSYSQMRCWRRGTFTYKYRAHEIPLPIDGWGKQVYTDFVWEHRPPPDRAWKSDYTLRRLQLDVQENPCEPRPMYYLGRQHMYRGEWDKAIEWLERFAGMESGHDKPDAWLCLSKCYAALGYKRQEISALHQMCAEDPLRREGWCGLADLYHQRGDDSAALGLLRCALELPRPPRAYVNHYWYGAAIHDLTARVLWKLGRYEEGRRHAERAVKLEPDDPRLKMNLAFFEAKREKGADYYDLVYEETASANEQLTWAVAERIVGGSVLDLGCGSGLLATMANQKYLGVDFSISALKRARERTPGARFLLADFYDLPGLTQFDTVVLQEVLEHVSDPAAVVEIALSFAMKRLVVTVPQNMPDPAHVKPTWTEDDLRALLGADTLIEPHGAYWIGTKDVD